MTINTATAMEEGINDWYEGQQDNPYKPDTFAHEWWRKGHFYAETMFGESQHLEASV